VNPGWTAVGALVLCSSGEHDAEHVYHQGTEATEMITVVKSAYHPLDRFFAGVHAIAAAISGPPRAAGLQR
jgi:hypothetical protein